MKILVICQYYYPEQFRINDICQELIKKGNDVTVLTGLPNYPEGIIPKEYKCFKKRKEYINGVKVIRCFEIARKKGAFFRVMNYISYMVSASFKAIFLNNKYDTIYVYQLSPITMAIPAVVYKKMHRNKKIKLYCLDLWPESLLIEGFTKDSIVYKIIKRVSIWIYKKCDSISVTSKEFIKYFQEELGINKNIEYMPQYAEELYNIEQEKNNKRKETNINLVFAGNIGKAQSVETIIKAANELKDESVNIHIVGSGVSLENCKKLTEKFGLNNVIFYGRKTSEEMIKYYEMADAMLISLSDNPIINKTIPGKLQSYMAYGKPIIGAIGGAANDIINEAKCGYVVDSEDYIGLANIIRKFKNDDVDIIKNMENNAIKYNKENFNKQNFINKLVKLLEEE